MDINNMPPQPVPPPPAPVEEVKAPEPVKEEVKAPEPPKAESEFYAAVKGDTYASIAAQFSISEEDLKALNPDAGKKIKDGTMLRVVDKNEYHTVAKGDNYGKIAKQYNLKLSDLKTMNNIKDEPITNYKRLIIKMNNTPPPAK